MFVQMQYEIISYYLDITEDYICTFEISYSIHWKLWCIHDQICWRGFFLIVSSEVDNSLQFVAPF